MSVVIPLTSRRRATSPGEHVEFEIGQRVDTLATGILRLTVTRI